MFVVCKKLITGKDLLMKKAGGILAATLIAGTALYFGVPLLIDFAVLTFQLNMIKFGLGALAVCGLAATMALTKK